MQRLLDHLVPARCLNPAAAKLFEPLQDGTDSELVIKKLNIATEQLGHD